MHKFKYILLLSLNVVFLTSFSQSKNYRDSSEVIPFIRFQYSYLFPAGDFEETYNQANEIGATFGFKTKSNWQFELEGNFMFGASIKRPDLLSGIINNRGDVTDSQGELIKLVYDLRGLTIFGTAGRIFTLNSKNQNSGLVVQAGIGFLQHKIKVDYRDGEAFQLNEEMLKGYDRLHYGFATKQFLGYQHFGRKNYFNFYLGLELQQGFTKNRREYNYDTKSFDLDRKTDFLYGFRFGWAIPIRERSSDDFYYR